MPFRSGSISFPSGGLFLTGPVGCGKTTVLQRALEGIPAKGIHTPRCDKEGRSSGFIMKPWGFSYPLSWRWIARYHGQTLRVYPHTFESFGTVLVGCALKESPLLVVDEIGFFENQAPRFCQTLLDCLDSPHPVVGVLKKVDTPFLKRLRHRSDVEILEVTQDNRETLALNLKSRLHEL